MALLLSSDGFIEQLTNNLQSSTPSPHQSIYSEKGHGNLLYQMQMFTKSGNSFEQPQCGVHNKHKQLLFGANKSRKRPIDVSFFWIVLFMICVVPHVMVENIELIINPFTPLPLNFVGFLVEIR